MVQDDGTAPIIAPAIEVGDDRDRKGEEASTSAAAAAALKESGNGFNTMLTYKHYITHSYKLLCDPQNVPLRLRPQLHPLVATIV